MAASAERCSSEEHGVDTVWPDSASFSDLDVQCALARSECDALIGEWARRTGRASIDLEQADSDVPILAVDMLEQYRSVCEDASSADEFAVLLSERVLSSVCVSNGRCRDTAAPPQPRLVGPAPAAVRAALEEQLLRSRVLLRPSSDAAAAASLERSMCVRVCEWACSTAVCCDGPCACGRGHIQLSEDAEVLLAMRPRKFGVDAGLQHAPVQWRVRVCVREGQVQHALSCERRSILTLSAGSLVQATAAQAAPASASWSITVTRASQCMLPVSPGDASAMTWTDEPPLIQISIGDGGDGALNRASVQLAVLERAPSRDADEPCDLYAWGNNALGCLGASDAFILESTRRVIPPSVFGRTHFRSISASACHAAAIASNAMLYTWGEGREGALGLGNTTSFTSPQFVEFFGVRHPLRVDAVAAGSDDDSCHTVVVARGWLADELTDGATEQPTSEGLPEFARCGRAVAERGRVFTFGSGHGVPTIRQQLTPALLKIDADNDMYDPEQGGIRRVAAGGGMSIALTATGRVYSWGKYEHGRLGVGVIQVPSAIRRQPARAPTSIPVPTRLTFQVRTPTLPVNNEDPPEACIKDVQCGQSHALALDEYGRVWVWGDGRDGQLGLPGATALYTPACLLDAALCIDSTTAVVSIAAGATSSMAVLAGGHAAMWGALAADADAEKVPRVVSHRTPSRIAYFDGECYDTYAVQACAGRSVVAFLTASGRVVIQGAFAKTIPTFPGVYGLQPGIKQRRFDTWTPLPGMDTLSRDVLRIACAGEYVLALAGPLTAMKQLATWVPGAETEAQLRPTLSHICGDMDLLFLGRTLRMHQCIVAATSERLRDILQQQLLTGARPYLNVANSDVDAVAAFVSWMYTRDDNIWTTLETSSLMTLCMLAEQYGVSHLAAAVQRHLYSPARVWVAQLQHEAETETGDFTLLSASEQANDSSPALLVEPRELLQELSALQASGKFCDTILLCKDGAMNAHAAVLAGASEVLAELLEYADAYPLQIAVDYTQEQVARLLDMCYRRFAPEQVTLSTMDVELATAFRVEHVQYAAAHASDLSHVSPRALVDLAASLASSELRQRCLTAALQSTAQHQPDMLAVLQDVPGVADALLAVPLQQLPDVGEPEQPAHQASESQQPPLSSVQRLLRVVSKLPSPSVTTLAVLLIGSIAAALAFNYRNTPAVPVINVVAVTCIMAIIFFAGDDASGETA